MIVELNGKKLRISIGHNYREVERLDRDGKLVKVSEPYRTQAQVKELRGEQFEVIASGTAQCHPNDQFCKATGRKIALTHALAGFQKDERQKIWEQYFENSATVLDPECLSEAIERVRAAGYEVVKSGAA